MQDFKDHAQGLDVFDLLAAEPRVGEEAAVGSDPFAAGKDIGIYVLQKFVDILMTHQCGGLLDFLIDIYSEFAIKLFLELLEVHSASEMR